MKRTAAVESAKGHIAAMFCFGLDLVAAQNNDHSAVLAHGSGQPLMANYF